MFSPIPRLAMVLVIAVVCTDAFSTPTGLYLRRPQLVSSRMPRGACAASLKMQSQPESEVDPRAWEPYTDPATGKTYYVNPVTGESAWERPSPKSTELNEGDKAPKQIFFAVDEDVRDERWNKFQKIMELQKEQDAIKRQNAGLANDGQKFTAVGAALLLFGLPSLVLAIGFFSGTLPNPFEVCIEGGTSCQ